MNELDDLLDPEVNDSSSGSKVQQDLPYAGAVLTLGILSIVGCFLYGLPGLICGIISLSLYKGDKKAYDANPQKYEKSYANSKAGFVCAIIGTSLSGLFLLMFILAIITGSGAFRF